MPEYLSPGVYIEEIDGPQPIEGVSTSTVGAVGYTARGPTDGKPVLITSFLDFQRTFGGFLQEPDPAQVNTWALDFVEGGRYWLFPLAVKGFFDNGGERMYVKRVFAQSATPAGATLGVGLVSEIDRDEAAGATQLTLRHLIGIASGTTIKVFNGETGSQVGVNLNIASYDPQTRVVTFLAGGTVPVAVKRGRDFVEILARSPSPVPAAERTLIFSAKAKGVWGNDLSVLVRPMVGQTFNVLNDPTILGAAALTTVALTAPPVTSTIQFASLTGFNNGDHVLVKGREYAISNKNTANVTFDFTPKVPAGETWDVGVSVKRLRPANAPPNANLRLWGASQLYLNALVELDNGIQKEIRTVSQIIGDVVTFTPTLNNHYFEGHKVRVIEAEVFVRYTPEGGGETDEHFSNLRLFDDNTTSFIVKNINLASQLVDVAAGAGFSSSLLSAFPIAPSGAWLPFENGDDKETSLSIDDFVGVDGGSGNRTGIQALEDIDEISISVVPAIWSATVQSSLIDQCETMRDRFAILDPRDGLSIQEVSAFRSPIDTKYAALYYPWIEVRDPSVKRNVDVAPSGHIAGVYARVDVDRGVYKAPANEVIRGITRIAQDVNKREQDILNPLAINALRFFPDRGNRVWGARVLTSLPEWKYVPVRRLFIFIEKSIDKGTQWVVFEPNDEPLWARVRQSVSNFLSTQWLLGALQGTTPDEAYFVKVDRTTMTQDDIDNGRLIVLVGIAPVKPAEFVIFRIQQKTLDTPQS